MAKVTYTLLDRPLSSITDNEKYSAADLSLIDNYEINKQYNFDKLKSVGIRKNNHLLLP